MDGPLAARYQAHLKDLLQIVTPSVVVYEVYKKLRRDASEAAAEASLEHGIPMADAIVYATALVYKATLITSDADFKRLPGVVYLPKK